VTAAVVSDRHVADDANLVIHHRKVKNAVMMIPSKGVYVESPAPKDPVTRAPQPNAVRQKQHRVWLDHDGNGEVCGAIWADICRSGYGHHFLVLPNRNRAQTQRLDMRATAKSNTVDVTTPEDGGRIRDRVKSTLHLYSTQVRQPIQESSS
jgi:hypothetical protein